MRFDKKNTGSLVSYLKRLSFQCIVISLKDASRPHLMSTETARAGAGGGGQHATT